MNAHKLHIAGAVLAAIGLIGTALPRNLNFPCVGPSIYIFPIGVLLLLVGTVCLLWGTRKSEPLRYWFVTTEVAVVALCAISMAILRVVWLTDICLYMAVVLSVVAIICLALKRKISRDDLPWLAAIAALFSIKWMPTLMHIENLFLCLRLKYTLMRGDGFMIANAISDSMMAILIALPLVQAARRRVGAKMPAVASVVAIATLLAWDCLLKIESSIQPSETLTYFDGTGKNIYSVLLHIRVLLEQFWAPCLAFAGVTLLVALLTPARRKEITRSRIVWAAVVALAVVVFDILRYSHTNIPVWEHLLTMPLAFTAMIYYVLGLFPKCVTQSRKLHFIGACALLLALAECLLLKPFKPYDNGTLDYGEEQEESETNYPVTEEVSPLQHYADSLMSDALQSCGGQYGLLMLIDCEDYSMAVTSEMTSDTSETGSYILDDPTLDEIVPLGLMKPILLAAICDDQEPTPSAGELAAAIASDKAMIALMREHYGDYDRDGLVSSLRIMMEQTGYSQYKTLGIPVNRLGNDRCFDQVCTGMNTRISPYELINLYHAIADGGANNDVRFIFEENHYIGNRLFSEAVADTLLSALRINVTEGDLRELSDLPVAAVKSANQYTVFGENRSDEYIAAIFPHDTPRYVCLITLFDTKPNNGQATKMMRKMVAAALVR